MNPFEPASPFAQRISDLTDRANQVSEHLDTFVNNLTISAVGVPLTVNYDPTFLWYPDTAVDLGSGVNSSFLAFVKRSDQPTRFYQLPYYEFISPNFTMGVTVWTDTGKIHFAGAVSNPYPGTVPASLTYYYYLLKQPADPNLS